MQLLTWSTSKSMLKSRRINTTLYRKCIMIKLKLFENTQEFSTEVNKGVKFLICMAEDHVALCTVFDLSYLFIVTTISNLWLQQVNFLPVWRKKPHRVKLLFEKTIAPNGDSCHDESHNDNNNFDRGFQQKVRIS